MNRKPSKDKLFDNMTPFLASDYTEINLTPEIDNLLNNIRSSLPADDIKMDQTYELDILLNNNSNKVVSSLPADDIKRYCKALYKTLQLDQPENRARLNDCHSIYKYSAKEINLSHRGKTPKSAKYSPDGSKLLVTYTDESFYLSDLKKPMCSWLKNNDGEVVDVIFSPDSAKVLIIKYAATNRFTIQLWSINARKMLWQKNDYSKASFSKDGQQVVTLSFNKLQKLDVKTGVILNEFSLWKTSYTTYISPDGSKFARSVDSCNNLIEKTFDIHNIPSAYHNRKINIHDTNTNICVYQTKPIKGKMHVTFTPDGKKVLFETENNATLLNIETKRQEWHNQKYTDIYLSQISLDGRIIVAASLDGHLRIWDTRTGQSTTIDLIQPSEKVHSISISPKYNIIVVTNKRTLNLSPSIKVQF